MPDAFDALSGAQWMVALGVSLVSAFIRGLSGFGLALMLVPVLALTFDPAEAVIAANVLGVVMGIASFNGARRAAERSALTITMLAVLFTPIGLLLLNVTPHAVARLAIAFIALSAFLAFIVPPPRSDWHNSPALAAGTGVTCGLCAGFAGMPGPPVVAFYLGRRIDKTVARASMFMIFLATSLAACGTALVTGIAGINALWLGIGLAPVVLLGNWLGSLAFGKVSELVWRMLAGAIVTGSAIVAIRNVVGG